MNAADPGRTDEELMAGTAGDIADEALEAAAGTADAQVGTWVNCTPIWWCPGADVMRPNNLPRKGAWAEHGQIVAPYSIGWPVKASTGRFCR